MARTNSLGNFLTDVATAIKTKKGDDTPILASDFDTEIENLPSGGGGGEEYFTTTLSAGSYNNPGVRNSIKKIPNTLVASDTSLAYAFFNCDNITDIEAINTTGVTNMNYMFNNCYSLTNVALFDTSSVTNMSYMFYNCRALTSIPQFNTSNVTNMDSMFGSCSALTSIPLLNTSNVTNMGGMFTSCSSLTSIPLLDTSNVINMYNMFTNVPLVNIPQFDTSSVTNMSNMFSGIRSNVTDESLNNILKMCINASSYTGTKKLSTLGVSTGYISRSRIEALTSYQDFVNAGWTI